MAQVEQRAGLAVQVLLQEIVPPQRHEKVRLNDLFSLPNSAVRAAGAGAGGAAGRSGMA